MVSLFKRCFGAKSLGNALNLGSNDQWQILVLGLDSAGKTTLLYRLKLGEKWPVSQMSKDLEEMRRKGNDKDGRKQDRNRDADKDKDKDRETLQDAGYHYEEFSLRNLNCGMWDVPGTPAMRQTWNIFYRSIKVQGIIFVVGCEDKLAERVLEDKIAELGKVSDPNEGRRLAELQHDLEKARKHTESRRNLAKKVLHILMNEDELSHACFAVILNQRRLPNKKGTVPDKEDDELSYRLGLKDLHESLATRVNIFQINLHELENENSEKFKDVWKFFKEQFKTMQENGYM